jgi:N-acetyl-gamma-glutamyl-phosphate reductase
MRQIRVGLVGVTGYTGMELARLLAGHPAFTLVRATSRAEAGKRLAAVYPFVQGLPLGDLEITEPDPADLAAACELVFLAVPHGTAMELAGALRRLGVKVVDLSADFRLRDPEIYAQWYGLEHSERELLAKEAVFGLPELHAEQIRTAELVANPGCYPTASILALHPALSRGLVRHEGIVIDAKSGATGAGRKAAVPTLYCEVADSFRAYNLGRHRHTPEIEQELAGAAGLEDMRISFNTHLLPINRGILATAYTTLKEPMATADAVAVYREAYAHAPWVRVLDSMPETRFVRGTMFCDIGLVADPRTGRLLVVSAIDNLCRGASGQALANANLMSGLDVDTGLRLAPMMP